MKTTRVAWIVAVVVVVGLLWGCAQGEYAPTGGAGASQSAMKEAASSSAPSAPAPAIVGGGRTVQGGGEADKAAQGKAPSIGTAAGTGEPDRYLIKNGGVTLEVKDARKASEQLLASVQAARGYVANLQETVDGLGARTVTLQVRVPAKSFEMSMRAIETLGKSLNKTVSAEDVTEEYVDSQSRVRNLKRTEDRLLEHLSKTGKLSDTLLIERELGRVREEIEKLEGRLRFLSHRVAYCTFDVTLQEAARQQALVEPESYSTGKVFSDAVRSLVDFARWLWTQIIWVAIWIPVWVPIFLVARWGYRRSVKKPSPPVG